MLKILYVLHMFHFVCFDLVMFNRNVITGPSGENDFSLVTYAGLIQTFGLLLTPAIF